MTFKFIRHTHATRLVDLSLTCQKLQYHCKVRKSCNHALTLNCAFLQEVNRAGEGRPWLLPLLREHVLSARLMFWKVSLAPMARTLADHRKDKKAAAQSRALASQIWYTLPAFCSWAEDTPEALG